MKLPFKINDVQYQNFFKFEVPTWQKPNMVMLKKLYFPMSVSYEHNIPGKPDSVTVWLNWGIN